MSERPPLSPGERGEHESQTNGGAYEADLRRYRLAFEATGDALWEIDTRTSGGAADERWYAMLGYTREDFLARFPDWRDNIHPDDRLRARETLDRFLADSRGHFFLRYRLGHKDGSWRWVLSRGSVVERDADGRALRLVGTHVDVTDWTEQKRRLSFSEYAVMSASIGIFSIAPDGTIEMANEQAARNLGYTREELRGMHLGEIDESMAPEAFQEMRAAFPEVGTTVFETEHTRKDGSTFPVEITVSRRRFDDQFVAVAFQTDLTERRETEAQQERLRALQQQAQRVESLGLLAGGVAHDLNNLLAPILGFGELVKSDLSPADPRREYVEQVLKAALGAKELVQQLLAIGRKQTLDYRPVDLAKVVRDMEPLLRRTIREDIALDLKCAPLAERTLADVGQLEQILLNLSINASDAMPQGGTLSIETDVVTLDEVYTHEHPEVESGRYLVLATSDTGVGMDAQTQSRIFEPFFSTKGRLGTGLGLATVHGIVKQHKGHIWVYSEEGQGTSFKIYLPVQDVPAQEPQPTSPGPQRSRGGERILVVEDNEPMRRVAEKVLQRLGYRLVVAGSGVEALERQEAEDEPFDLLLTDVILPDFNGRELFELLQERQPGLKALYMSGYTDNVVVRHGVLKTGVRFLQKPFTIEALAAKVRDALDE